MRYLSKIIFVNSANISYAEISLDGNVHFTGTQGVGKSTVLRALLFFYNADKQKLGIQQGQKPFDEFYFRQANSYILYEVMRDESAYTILVSRYQGRASYRFIDAPYDRSWLVDEAGQVAGDWVKIRGRIDKGIAVSARIDSGAFFRDIIFGNTHDHKYTRYALAESSNYQNVPRSIQNVFLNTKLEADFIKNTIIQSMSEQESPLDMNTYRRLVCDFEREYEEIDCWFRKDKEGGYPVRQQAQRIAEGGRMLFAYLQQMKEVWQEMNYAARQSEERIPLLESEVQALQDKKSAEEQRKAELSQAYQKDKDGVVSQMAVGKSDLKRIAEKRKYFDGIDIAAKLALSEKEPWLKQQLAEKQNLLADLLKKCETIEEKYKLAEEKLSNARRSFEIAQSEALNRKRDELQRKRDAFAAQHNSTRDKLAEAYEAWRKESETRLEDLLGEQHRCESRVAELRKWHPMADEMAQVDAQLQNLLIEEKECRSQQVVIRSQLDKLQQEGELRQKEMLREYDRKLEELLGRSALLKEEKDRIEQLLARLNGTLYKWLVDNVDGWESNIGRVVDEKNVLYAEGLEPRLSMSGDGLFGVQLNIDAIQPTLRTPDEYRERLEQLNQENAQLGKALQDLQVAQEEDTAKLSRQYADKKNPLRQKFSEWDLKERQIPARRQELENKRHSLEMAELEQVEAETAKRQAAYSEAILRTEEEKKEREKRETRHKRELKELDATLKKQKEDLRAELDAFVGQQDEAKAENEARMQRQLAMLRAQRREEERGNGVDVAVVEAYRKEVDDIEAQLRTIDSNREAVIDYRNNERELFCRETDIRKEIKMLDAKLQQMIQQYEDRKVKIVRRIEELSGKMEKCREELSSRQEGLRQYKDMVELEHLVPANIQNDAAQKRSDLSCQELISRMRGVVNSRREEMESLKQKVNLFNRNFKPQNAFHFNTTPFTDEDYVRIAADVQDFLDNDKLEEFRSRTSEHFKDILQRISVEVGQVMKQRADVDRVIGEINRDFVEKNFVGVIKSIELQSNDSSDPLMQLLLSIQRFTEENALTMGEMNLFSGDNREEVNRKVVEYLKSLSRQLRDNPSRDSISLGDTFRLQFRVRENDNDTGWVERINNVGSDGTDILVKAMVNIMLINVFKKKAVRRGGDFIVHCMMDEIGRLHPNNIKGILQFANTRNIYLVNSSPTSYNAYDYKYTYMLSKNGVKTQVARILKKI